MHDLIVMPDLAAGSLTASEIDATMAYAENEKSAATRAAYASDWKDFAVWCFARGATPLPAHVGIVAAYLSALADSGRRSSTIGRRAAAIGYRHKMAGYEPPANQEAVKAVLRGIRRTIGSARTTKAPATAEIMTKMLATCRSSSLLDVRDRALLALGFAGAFRRSELAALEVSDLTEVDDGFRVLIRRSKGDQEGQGPISPSRAATGSVRSRRSRRGWRRPRSARAGCSGRWQTGRWPRSSRPTRSRSRSSGDCALPASILPPMPGTASGRAS